MENVFRTAAATAGKNWLLMAALVLMTLPRDVAAEEPCDKNHYILGLGCYSAEGAAEFPPESVLDVPIGKAAAIVADALGNVYFSSPHVVFRLDAAGGMRIVAGGATPGFAGDGGPASSALLNIPTDDYPELNRDPIGNYYEPLLGGLAVDRGGNLYIADAYNNRIRRVSASGVIATIVSGTPSPFPWTNVEGPEVRWPYGIALDQSNNLYIASSTGQLLKRAPDGELVVVSGPTPCGPQSEFETNLCSARQIAADPQGGLVVNDAFCRVIRVRADGTAEPIAGTAINAFASCGLSTISGPATQALLNFPHGVAVAPDGVVYIADTSNHCIRKVESSGSITTFAGFCQMDSYVWERHPSPSGQAAYRQRLYAGGGYEGDGGPATLALLNKPLGVTVDPSGNVFIADTGNLRIRKVTPEGIISTVAGNGQPLTASVVK